MTILFYFGTKVSTSHKTAWQRYDILFLIADEKGTNHMKIEFFQCVFK